MECIDENNKFCGFMVLSVCCADCRRPCQYKCEKVDCEFHETNIDEGL